MATPYLPRVLVMGPTAGLERIFTHLEATGLFQFRYAPYAKTTVALFDAAPDIVLLHVPSSGERTKEAMELLEALKEEAPVIVFSPHEDLQVYLDVMWRGAFDYFTLESPGDEILRLLYNAVAWRKWRDERDLLEVLKSELDFLQDGGYGRSLRTRWKPTSLFLDSPTCLDFGARERPHRCQECVMMRFVPAMRRSKDVPCHHIPLNDAGDTVDSLAPGRSETDLEEAVRHWLQRTVAGMEAAQAKAAAGIEPHSS